MSETIEFIDDKERELFARARLGEAARAFLRSELGRYLHGRARNELDSVKEEILDCNPWTPWGRRKINKLQLRAEVARSFMRYCVDAITDGDIAFQELEERDER